jgi:hypothetical protein
MAEEELCPRGEWRADLRMAILAATMANLWIDSKSKRMKPSDFMPDFDRKALPERPQTREEIMSVMTAWTTVKAAEAG